MQITWLNAVILLSVNRFIDCMITFRSTAGVLVFYSMHCSMQLSMVQCTGWLLESWCSSLCNALWYYAVHRPRLPHSSPTNHQRTYSSATNSLWFALALSLCIIILFLEWKVLSDWNKTIIELFYHTKTNFLYQHFGFWSAAIIRTDFWFLTSKTRSQFWWRLQISSCVIVKR